MLKILLVRHTETEWNEQFRYIGRTDMSLSPLGRKHAEIMGDWFKSTSLQAVYSSYMARAVETATALVGDRGLTIQQEADLREIDFGAWEGLTHAEIQERHPDELQDWLRDPAATQIPGGEGWSDFESRVGNALTAVAARHDDGTVVIVTHGGPIKAIVGGVLGLPASRYWQLYLDKGAISSLVRDERGFRLTLLNDTCYLRS